MALKQLRDIDNMNNKWGESDNLVMVAPCCKTVKLTHNSYAFVQNYIGNML